VSHEAGQDDEIMKPRRPDGARCARALAVAAAACASIAGRMKPVTASGPSRLYPNRNPAANIKVNREEIATLQPFFGQYRIMRPHAHGQLLPNARFVFITSADGEIRLHPRYRHPVLANGEPVRYAGEAQFRHGQLEWWSNASGNYRPDPQHASQAGLPMDTFFTHEQVRSGIQQLKTLRALAPSERGKATR
jgi:hypothetical protein